MKKTSGWAAVGRAVADRMRELGLSKRAVHAAGGPSIPTLDKILRGEKVVRIEPLSSLARVLGWPPTAIEDLAEGRITTSDLVDLTPPAQDDSIDLNSLLRHLGQDSVIVLKMVMADLLADDFVGGPEQTWRLAVLRELYGLDEREFWDWSLTRAAWFYAQGSFPDDAVNDFASAIEDAQAQYAEQDHEDRLAEGEPDEPDGDFRLASSSGATDVRIERETTRAAVDEPGDDYPGG